MNWLKAHQAAIIALAATIGSALNYILGLVGDAALTHDVTVGLAAVRGRRHGSSTRSPKRSREPTSQPSPCKRSQRSPAPPQVWGSSVNLRR